MSLELNPVFEGSGLQLGPVFDVTGVPTIGIIVSGDTTLTIPYTGAVTHYRVYEIGSAAPAWISAPPSPIVFTGISNREYQVEVSGDGSTVADSEQAGTNNPGTGGGELRTPSEFAAGAILSGVVAGGALTSGGVSPSFGAGAVLGAVVAGGQLNSGGAFAAGPVLAGVIAAGTLQGAVVSAFGAGALLQALRAGGSLFGELTNLAAPPCYGEVTTGGIEVEVLS